jgi:beta-xylosidase
LSREECFDGQDGYNFRKLDLVLDFLLENGWTPYLELGHKPTLFMYTPERSVREMEDQGMYTYYTFKGIIRALCVHLANRYGAEELERWYFEYWNDPKHRIAEEDALMIENGSYRYPALKFVRRGV